MVQVSFVCTFCLSDMDRSIYSWYFETILGIHYKGWEHDTAFNCCMAGEVSETVILNCPLVYSSKIIFLLDAVY